MNAQNSSRVKIAIIGAGHSGLCMGMKLKDAGISDFLILEKAAALGGTWRDNTYPGASCDAPSFLYSFSFAQKTDWSRRFAWQSELLAYSAECAIRYGLLPHCRFDAEVQRVAYDDHAGTWTLTCSDGSTVEAVLAAAGVTFPVTSGPSKVGGSHSAGMSSLPEVCHPRSGWTT